MGKFSVLNYRPSRNDASVERTGNEIAHENAFHPVHWDSLRVLCLHSSSLIFVPPLRETDLIDCTLFRGTTLSRVCVCCQNSGRLADDLSFVCCRWKTRAITATTTPDASSCRRWPRYSGPGCPASFAVHQCSSSIGTRWWMAPFSCHPDSTRPPAPR